MSEGLSRLLNPDDCKQEVCKTQESYLDTIVGNLVRKQTRAKQEYDNATAAIDALKANPAIAQVLELVSKAGR